MPLLDRFMNAWAGARAGWAGSISNITTPHRGMNYGDWAARCQRYALADAYYFNEIYDSLNLFSLRLRTNERLYKFIRGIFNPVERQNNLIVSYSYRGTIDTTSFKTGALPLIFENKAMLVPLQQIAKWSNLGQQLNTFVKRAALYGDVAWWGVDEPDKRRVRLELLDPERIKYVERDSVGNVKSCVIEYEYDDQPEVDRYQPTAFSGMRLSDTKTHVKTLIATQEKFSTFRDGEPFPFYQDADGNPMPEWDNIYGFVPLKLAYYAEGQDGWGRNSFFGTPRRQIDELNDQASIINDSVRNVVVPLLQAKGVTKADEIKVSREDKDSMAILYLTNPVGSIEPVTIPLDIAGATSNRNDLLAELKSNMPELKLSDARDIGRGLSGVALETMFGDGISRINFARGNLDPAVASALQMAITMGGIQGYDGFSGFTADSYDAGKMELRVADRSVLDDSLSREDRITNYPIVAALPPELQRDALQDMGKSDDDIKRIVADSEKQATQAAQQQQQAVTAQSMARLNDIHQRAGLTALAPQAPPNTPPEQQPAKPEAQTA